jgi:hypothetical protein
MCFSASASFTASTLLVGLGAASIARNGSKPHRMFAAVPLIFAAQQAAEGTVWLTMHDPSHAPLHQLAVSAFLAVALVIWPVWLPLSLLRVERSPLPRRVLQALSLAGVLLGTYTSSLLVRWRPIARLAGHSLRYEYTTSDGSPSQVIWVLAYLLPTILPLFVSTIALGRTIGTLVVVSLAITFVIERNALASVWCFFAAIISGLIVFAIGREQLAVPAAAT